MTIVIVRLLSIVLVAYACIGGAMVAASERDFVLPKNGINDQAKNMLDIIEIWEEKYQHLAALMARGEIETTHYAHPLDQEYARLEKVVYKARLLRDVVKEYSTVAQQIKLLYQRRLNSDGQEMNDERAWSAAISSSREMIQVGYQLDNKALNAAVINLVLSTLSDNHRDQREFTEDMNRTERYLSLRHSELASYKERLRDWIRLLRSEVWKG